MQLRRVRDPRTGAVELHTSQRDVTERLLAQQELTRFRDLAERAGDFIGMTTRAGAAST